MKTISLIVQEITEAHYSGSSRSSNGWTYRGYDSNHIRILISYPLSLSNIDQERLSRYISSKYYYSNCDDEDYSGNNMVSYSRNETDSLINIFKFIFPHISFIAANEMLPFEIYTTSNTIKYKVNEKEFLNENYDTEQYKEIIQLLKTTHSLFSDVIFHGLIKSTDNNIAELIDSIEYKITKVCDKKGVIFPSIISSKNERVKKLLDYQSQGFTYQKSCQEKISEIINFYVSCGAELPVEPLPKYHGSYHQSYQHEPEYDWIDIGRDEMNGLDEESPGWRDNID